MAIREFLQRHYHHFNAGALADCAESLNGFLGGGRRMNITLAGAMSTAGIGRSLAPAIRTQKVHAICCTGANLEEALFRLVASSSYERVQDWRDWRAESDAGLAERGMNRVTDVAIPEDEAIRYSEKRLLQLWQDAEDAGDRRFPPEYLYDRLRHGEIEFDAAPQDSW